MGSASTVAARRRVAVRSRSKRRISWRTRIVIALALLAALAAGYYFWLRHSSLVAIDDVEVVGVTNDHAAITDELTNLAEGMTTLDVDRAKLEAAATSHPTIESISVDPNFP